MSEPKSTRLASLRKRLSDDLDDLATALSASGPSAELTDDELADLYALATGFTLDIEFYVCTRKGVVSLMPKR